MGAAKMERSLNSLNKPRMVIANRDSGMTLPEVYKPIVRN